MTNPLTEQQLTEYETRAASLYEYGTLADQALQADLDQLTGEDVPLLTAEIRRLRDELARTREDLDFLGRTTLPELRRNVQHHQDGKQRWRERAEKAEARAGELEAELAPTVDAKPAATSGADVDLTDGPVRCPLCSHPVTLHTPNGARAHFTSVHPEQRLTGRGAGPWPLLVTDGTEARGNEPESGADQADSGEQPRITVDPDRDGVILHLPDITYLDTQVWAVDIGLTTNGLDALRTVLAAETRGNDGQDVTRATRYTSNLVPETFDPGDVYAITVDYRGDDRWAVLRHGLCLSRDGRWDRERVSSEREEEWLDAHRFDLATAGRLAEEQATDIAPAKWRGRNTEDRPGPAPAAVVEAAAPADTEARRACACGQPGCEYCDADDEMQQDGAQS